MNLVPPFIEVEALQFDRIFFSRGGPFPQISAVGTWVSMSRPSGAWKRNRTSALSTTLCKEFLCPTLDGGGDVGFKDKLMESNNSSDTCDSRNDAHCYWRWHDG
jgi:hypothetical protein